MGLHGKCSEQYLAPEYNGKCELFFAEALPPLPLLLFPTPAPLFGRDSSLISQTGVGGGAR